MGFLLLLVLFLSQKAAAKSRGVHKEDEGNYSVSCEVGGNKNPHQNTEGNRAREETDEERQVL